VMGLEEHLLVMFRDDFEFADDAGASHLAAHSPRKGQSETAPQGAPQNAPAPDPASAQGDELWTLDAQKELRKIPFFVRGKARKNTEKFANEQGRAQIDLETLYDAKAYYAR